MKTSSTPAPPTIHFDVGRLVLNGFSDREGAAVSAALHATLLARLAEFAGELAAGGNVAVPGFSARITPDAGNATSVGTDAALQVISALRQGQ